MISTGFPVVSLRFSIGFPMVFIWFPSDLLQFHNGSHTISICFPSGSSLALQWFPFDFHCFSYGCHCDSLWFPIVCLWFCYWVSIVFPMASLLFFDDFPYRFAMVSNWVSNWVPYYGFALVLLRLSIGFPMVFIWFPCASYSSPMVPLLFPYVFLNAFHWFSYGFHLVPPMASYCFPMILIWFPYGFPWVFHWFSIGLPMDFISFPMVSYCLLMDLALPDWLQTNVLLWFSNHMQTMGKPLGNQWKTIEKHKGRHRDTIGESLYTIRKPCKIHWETKGQQ